MTRTVRRLTDIPIVAGDLRRAGELLGRPCGCDHHGTLGEHILRATRDMTAGLAAQNTDPGGGGGRQPDLGIDRTDPAAGLHDQVLDRVNTAWAAALALTDALQELRPDRGAHLELVTLTDDDWCRSCLRIGKCNPRHRGDLCRHCYDFNLMTKQDPPIWLVSYRQEHGRVPDKLLADAIREVRPKRRKKRRAG